MTRILRTAGTFLQGQGTLAASAQTLLISIAILCINVMTGVVTARFLGVAGRGEQEAMGLWPHFLAYLFTLGLPSSLVYNLKRKPEQASKIFSAAFLASLVAGTLAVVIGFFLVPLWLKQHDPEVIQGARILMFFAPAVLLDFIYASALRAQGSFTIYNGVRFLRPAATLVALLTLGFSGWLTPFTAGLCYLIPSLPFSAWMLARVWQTYRPVWQGLRESFQNLASYGVRAFGIDLLGTLSEQIDKVMVVGLLSASGMGLYAAALSLSRMLNVFQGAVSLVIFPKASGLSTEEAVDLAGRAARFSTAVTLISALLLCVMGPWVLGLLFGPEFLDAVVVMRLLILVSVLEGTSTVLGQAFMATNRPGLVTVRQGLGLLFNLPLLLFLVPRFGLTGAGISLVITSFLRLLFIIVSFSQVLKVPPPRLWLNRSDIRELLARVRHV